MLLTTGRVALAGWVQAVWRAGLAVFALAAAFTVWTALPVRRHAVAPPR